MRSWLPGTGTMARVAELLAVVAEQGALIESLRAEVAALRRQAGRDSSNSSQPPSQDGPAAGGGKAKAAGPAGAAGPGAGRAERPSGCEPRVGRPAG